MNFFTSKFSILILLIFLSSTFYVSSQNNPEYGCGTITSKESLDFFNSIRAEIKQTEKKFTAKSSSLKETDDIKTEYISIQAHIVRNSNGSGGLNMNNLNRSIENINAIFKDLYFQFSLNTDINYIDDDNFTAFKKTDESKLTKNNYTKGVLNIYFVESLINESQNNICGYANVANNANIIVMQNSCAPNDSSLAHEIGHFLSLIHTHDPNDTRSTELVNGSNCDTDGDGICDTPADPKLDFYNIDNFCNYTGTATDANGDAYQPDTENMMSYSYKGCRIHFSKQQSARMYAYYQYIKSNLESEGTNEEGEEPLLANTKIYPNPVSNGILNISSKTSSSTRYQISNFYGQVLSEGQLITKEIDVSNLSSGTYLLALIDNNSKVVKKFIK